MSASRSTVQPADPAVAVGRDPDALDLVAAVVHGQVALAAGLGPLDRLADLAGDQHGEHLLGGDLELGAEAAADVGRDHPQLVLGDAVTPTSTTRRTCGIWVADQRVNSSPIQCATTARGSIALGMSRCWMYSRSSTTGASAEGRLDVAVARTPTRSTCCPASCTLGGPRRAPSPCRAPAAAARSRPRWPPARRPPRTGRGRPRGHGLADVTDLVHRHRRVVGITMSAVTGHAHGRLPCSPAKSAPEKAAITPGCASARGDVDPGDPGVRHRAAQERHVQHAGELDVVGPVGPAGDEPGVLLAQPRRPSSAAALRLSAVTGARPRLVPRAARRGRCSDSRCSGRGCPPGRRGSPSSVGSGCP